MSQSGSSTNASAGSTFATRDGPWPRYVRHFAEQGDEDARRLLQGYEFSVWDLLLLKSAYFENGILPAFPDISCAQILDTDLDNNVQVWSTLTYKQFHDAQTQAHEVDRFIDDLRTCGPKTQSRILVLNTDFLEAANTERPTEGELSNLDEQAFTIFKDHISVLQDLFIGHILAIEYDMSFPDVHRKLRQSYIGDEQVSRICGLRYTSSDMLFYRASGFWTSAKSTQIIRVCALGSREVGAQTVDHNIIQFTSAAADKSYTTGTRDILVDQVVAVSKPSEVAGLPGATPNGAQRPYGIAASEIVARILRDGDWKDSKHGVGSFRTHWLNPPLRWTTASTMYVMERSERSCNGPYRTLKNMVICNALRTSGDVAQATVDQVDMFLELHPSYCREDCQSSLKQLRRVAKMAEAFASRLARTEEAERIERQMQMTELSITESRSTIGLTVIASIFVPVSLASSIFGMNIQEINQEGHSIWAFVLCAVTMCLLTGMAWLSWQARRNWKVARHRLTTDWFWGSQWPLWGYWERMKGVWREYGYSGGYMTSLLYVMGFRRFEKAGLSKV